MINEILRGPLTIKHPYLPDNVKLVTYNIVSDDITKRLARRLGSIYRPDEITATIATMSTNSLALVSQQPGCHR